MPDCVAHYQFGQDVLSRLEKLKSCALSYQWEYDIGLQGPDIFFFYQPYHKTQIADYGSACHKRPAIQMFIPILAQVREKAALAYMMGLVCHYTLDACCHPYVNGHSHKPSDHHRMEAAYDRYILSRYKSVKSRHLLADASQVNFDEMAALWPGMSPDILRECMKSKRRYTWLLDHPPIVLILETVAGRRGAFTPLSLPKYISEEQQGHMQRLDELYFQGLDMAEERIYRAYEAMGTALERLAGFEMNYEGEIVYE